MEAEEQEERVLVLGYTAGQIGGVLFDIHSGELKIVPNFPQDLAIDTTAVIFNSLSPTRVVVPVRLEEDITLFIQKKSVQLNFTVDLVSSTSYRQRLSDLVVEGLIADQSPLRVEDKSLLSSLMTDMNLSVSRSCFFALQNFIQSILQSQDLDGVSLETQVRSTSIFQADSLMYLSEDTLLDLQIFKNSQEQHCLFDLFICNCGSGLGQRYLRNLFKSPLADEQCVRTRLEIVETLLREDNAVHLEDIIKCQKGIGDIYKILNGLTTNKLQLSFWNKMKSLLRNAIEIVYAVREIHCGRPLNVFHDLLEKEDKHILESMENVIESVIDFEESALNQRVYVKDGFNEELDEARARYNELERILAEFANVVSQNNPNIPQDALNVVYIPQLGYLTSIDRNSVSLEHVNEDWKEVFSTASNWYFKEEITEGADERYGDVYQIIVDGEIEILTQLQMEMLENEQAIIKTCIRLANLDCYCAIAQTSLQQGFTKPDIVSDPILKVHQGRNALVESQVNSFIANDTMVPEGQLAIITGANGSGKSVYLVQIGQIIFLSHIGSFIPAQSSQIGIVDKLLTKIHTHESIGKCQSTFYTDLQKMSNCIHQKTNHSVLLVDEFGKGTDVIGGPALLGAIVEHLNGVNPGRCFITTHFHELFKDKVLMFVDKVKHYHMDVMFTNDEDPRLLTYLFGLKEGLATDSFGIICAENNGVPSEITKRAWEILRSEKELKDDSLNEAKVNKAKLITKRFLEWDLDCNQYSNQDISEKLAEILQDDPVKS